MHTTLKVLTSAIVIMMLTNVYQWRIFVAGKTDMEIFKENVQRNRMFKCGPSQPRIIKWENILTGKDRPNKACEVISPHVAVLHKCDFEAGYCSSRSHCCKAERVESVTLVFQITRFDFENFNSCPNLTNDASKTRYVKVIQANDTVCSCQPNHNTPK